MTELIILDFSIGLLLLVSLAMFYESANIFYVMLGFHIIIITFCLSIFIQFSTVVMELLKMPGLVFIYAIPFAVQILFAASFVILRAALNPVMTIQDVVLICATPALVLCVPFTIPRLQIFMSKYARCNIYDSWNLLGLITNTFILILGGRLGWFAYKTLFI